MRQESGFILITTVLVLLALSVTLAAATLSFSLGSTSRSLALERGGRVLALADGCMDEALFRIRGNAAYDDETIDLGDTDCAVSVERTGDDYTVITEVVDDGHTRRVTAEVNRGASQLTLQSWLVQ